MSELLRAGRAAFDQRDWTRAREAFRQAAETEVLEADDVFALADCAWWQGEIDEALEAYEQSHDRYVQAGLASRAAMASLLLGAHAMERGDVAVGSGWMSRARRLLRDAPECPEHGYPLYWDVFAAMARGDLDEALTRNRRHAFFPPGLRGGGGGSCPISCPASELGSSIARPRSRHDGEASSQRPIAHAGQPAVGPR